MNTAQLTSKGQVTIPKEIRRFLELDTGDFLVFDIIDSEAKIINLRKGNKEEECPECKGNVLFEQYNLPCFVCDQTSFISYKKPVLAFIFQIPFGKYKVSCNTTQYELSGKGQFEFKLIPKLTLNSSEYPKKLLDRIQDTLQMMLIEEYVPRNLLDSSKFPIPSDIILEEILQLLSTNEAKKEVEQWFRYDRTI